MFWTILRRQPAHVPRLALSAFLDGRLEPRDMDRAAAHLEGCPRCQAELRALEATIALMRRLPLLPTTRDFTLRERPIPVAPAPLARQAVFMARLAAAASVLVFALFLGADLSGALGRLSTTPPLPQAAPSASRTKPQVTAPTTPQAPDEMTEDGQPQGTPPSSSQKVLEGPQQEDATAINPSAGLVPGTVASPEIVTPTAARPRLALWPVDLALGIMALLFVVAALRLKALRRS
ncbi:MAG: zf-HC2 domain-containing protein [Chloroflexi bacterium]|nr:zf-HC2 domain-containing protein [Chloroflexota bacterium]